MFTQREIRMIKRKYIKRQCTAKGGRLIYGMKELVFDTFRLATMIIMTPVLLLWATVKAVILLGLHIIIGTVAGFTCSRLVLIVVDACAWVIIKQGTVYHFSNFVKFMPILVAAVLLLINSIHHLLDQFVFYEIGECFSEGVSPVVDLFESTWIFRTIDDIRINRENKSNKVEPLTPAELRALVESEMDKQKGTANIVVASEENSEREKEIKASADIFGDCFSYEEIGDRYKALYKKYHPETGTAPNQAAYDYLMLAFRGTTKWIATDKELLEYIK